MPTGSKGGGEATSIGTYSATSLDTAALGTFDSTNETAGWGTFTTISTTESTTFGTHQSTAEPTTQKQNLFEYALKCTSDPSKGGGGSAPNWAGTDDEAESWTYGTVAMLNELDPSEWGSEAKLVCIVAGKGASVADNPQRSFTISSKVTSCWENPGVLFQGQIIGLKRETAISNSQIRIFLPDPLSPFVQVAPQVQVTSSAASRTDAKVQAHNLTIPAVVIAGSASYEDRGADVQVKQDVPLTGTALQWTGKKTSFRIGPITLAWSFVLVRRRRGSYERWEIDPQQPPTLTHGNTPNPPS